MGFIVRRLLWMVPTLLGVSLVAFLALDWAPLDRAAVAIERTESLRDHDQRARARRQLEIEHGLVDPETKERLPVLDRYGRWLTRVVTLQFHDPGDDPVRFRERLVRALPVTVLLNVLSLFLAVVVAMVLGARMGLAPGSRLDRLGSGVLFALFGTPEFVLATVLLALTATWGVFPSRGLHSPEAAQWGGVLRMLDTAWHLVLPTVTLAAVPTVVLTRYVREAVLHASRSGFVLNLRAWGAEPARVRRAVRRAGWSPIITQLGALLPLLVGGSVVVETIFGIPGMGQLAWQALMDRDQGTIMTLFLFSAVLILVGILVSDLLYRARDRRVHAGG